MLQCINGKMKYKTNINLETLNLKKKKNKRINNFLIKYFHKMLQCINRKKRIQNTCYFRNTKLIIIIIIIIIISNQTYHKIIN